MRAVDTNLLVRLIVRDDVKQVSAADNFVDRGAWVSHLALAEATWVL
ncbi:MAG: PIN domain-containing protein, partial [Candidatus Rokuibacteriota bacterium]